MKTTDAQQLYFLTGGAGVDKTFQMNMVYQTLLKYLNKQPGSDPALPRKLIPSG